MQNTHTTVLFIGGEDKAPHSIQVSNKLLKNYKKILGGASAVVAFFIIASVVFLYSTINKIIENNQLTEKISSMQNDLKLMDSLHIREKVQSIENRIGRINEYLHDRGVDVDSSVGGEISDNLRLDVSIYDFYNEQTSDIFQDLRNVPVGFPFYGELSSEYGYRRNPFGGSSTEFHSGMDFKGDVGSPIKVTADGTVVNADWHGGYGQCVEVDHGNGYHTLYGHLSGFNVSAGQKLKAGDVVGFLGSTGRSTGPHIHYEIRKDGVDINPYDYLYLK